ncbi:MAG: hypothetical protein HQ518_23375 [Rhodopirellula sp.]|nr:hypothetical protein [Rhodopirellula sp.]
MNAIQLENFKSLFKDDDAFTKFVELFGESIQYDLRPIICGQRVIGATLSADGTKDVLYDRMVKRMVDSPDILNELVSRIEEEEIVD